VEEAIDEVRETTLKEGEKYQEIGFVCSLCHYNSKYKSVKEMKSKRGCKGV